MIIGKGGGFIKQIKEESGAYIQISQKAKDQALQERCITVIGENDCNRKACCMILSKIAEDPQSGSCLNVSYAEVTGPVANFNPTGSPYAHNGGSGANGGVGSGVGVGSNGNGTGGYSPIHNGNSGASPYMNNMSVNLNIGVGLSQPNPAVLSQLMDHLRSSLRNAGYPEQSLSEVGQAINTLASYGMIGMNFSSHANSAVDNVTNVAGSWMNHNVSATDGGHGVPSSSPGPFGPIGSSPHRFNESSYDPFRQGRGSYQTPLPLNNNSFGLGSPHSPVAQDRTSDSINTSPRGSENSR